MRSYDVASTIHQSLTTGKTVATLNRLKKKLGEITRRGEWLRKEMQERKDMLVRWFKLSVGKT